MAADFLRHFQYFAANYDDQGRPRRKRLLGGTWFSRAKQNKNRKQDFIRKLVAYSAGSQLGTLPLAPDDWEWPPVRRKVED